MKLKGITDVFFDLDHTLWDFDKNSALAFDKIFKINQVEINLDDFLHHYKEINFQYWKLYRDEKIDKDVLRFGRLNDTFLALNFAIDKDKIQNISTDYITYLTDNNYLYDNAIVILDYLYEKYNLHIISNGFEEVQYKKLTKSNIHHYFKTITNGEDIGVKKPNPQIFHFAVEKANTSIAKSIMIGDGYEADILGALSVGMDVIFFDEYQKPIDQEIKKINNLLELKKYL
jgi:putative hydrolase of the HAD superfamily